MQVYAYTGKIFIHIYIKVKSHIVVYIAYAFEMCDFKIILPLLILLTTSLGVILRMKVTQHKFTRSLIHQSHGRSMTNVVL